MRETSVQELRRLQHFKAIDRPGVSPLGGEMVDFLREQIERRHTKLAQVAERFAAIIPESLIDHCTLDGLTRGTLTVLVDSAPHRYELKQLLLAGVQDQLVLACKSAGLRKIKLKPGKT